MDEPIPWTTGVIEHEGETLYYEEAGDGPPLVLCHGAGGNHAIWYQQVAHFAPGYRVVTWDQRGFGHSTLDTGDMGPRAAVRDLAALLDHVEVERAHVVGQSMGGWCALGFALDHPDRVASLVLADTIGGIMTAEISEILSSMPRPPLPSGSELGVHPAIWGLDDKDPAQAFLYQQLSGMRADAPTMEAVVSILQTQWDLDAVRSLETPTLFVFGGDDNLFPPKALRAAASQVPDAEIVEIPGSTHSPYFEAAAEWNAAVEEFLDRHR